MKKTKFTESQIIGILKEQEQGKKVADICREHGISQPTFYQWKSKYSGLDVQHLKKLKELESELSTLLRSFEELSFLPEDFDRLVRLVQKKLPLPSMAGYDAGVLISYFEETYFGGTNGYNESCSQQLEIVFEELIVYRTVLASLPNYFDLRPIQRFNITSRTGLYVKDVECLIRQMQFTNPALRTILNAIHYELD